MYRLVAYKQISFLLTVERCAVGLFKSIYNDMVEHQIKYSYHHISVHNLVLIGANLVSFITVTIGGLKFNLLEKQLKRVLHSVSRIL